MEAKQRKNYLDNIRWITILIVVVYHVFYYYNNLGTTPMFEGLHETTGVTFSAVFQYAVYQWFMVLLFIVSGICARYTLEKKTVKQFIKSKVDKLLIPSTLGVMAIHWIDGYCVSLQFMTGPEAEKIPGFVKYIIMFATGIGQLWFLQVLFFNCLLLLLIRKIDRNERFYEACGKANVIVELLLVVVMILSAQVLNLPIAVYRMCYYPMAFLLGYFVFSHEKVLNDLKKFWYVFMTIGIIFGVIYTVKFYGTFYGDAHVMKAPVSVVHAYFTALGILGFAQNFLNFSNAFTDKMNKYGWAVYMSHIMILLIFNTAIKPFAGVWPMQLIYLLELVVSLAGSVIMWEIFSRIPVIRLLMYGVRGKKR